MTASVAGVTDNASVGSDTPVTHNAGCTACDSERRNPSSSRSYGAGRHCTGCHKDSHRACVECGTCLPSAARYDRFYCSVGCRHKVYEWRRGPEAAEQRARQAVLMSDPMIVASLAAIRAMGDPKLKARKALIAEARETAEVCAKCGATTPTTQPVWRMQDSGPVLTVCYACRCVGEHRGSRSRCADCRPEGSWARVRWYCAAAYSSEHPTTYCVGCHPKAWRAPRSCEGCGRIVMNQISIRPGYRWSGLDGYRREYEYGRREDGHMIATDRVFCSDRCRRSTLRAEYRAKADRDPVDCAVCHERIDARRRDSRYCSDACRQKAYRNRSMAVAEVAP